MIATAISENASPAAISAAGLVKRYGNVTAVDGLDLESPAGQFFGLLGPNGSGKTTTIHMLATLVKPSEGRVRIADVDVSMHPVQARRHIGLVFQESALDRTLTVRENLRFAGRLYNLPPSVSDHRSAESFHRPGELQGLHQPDGEFHLVRRSGFRLPSLRTLI